MTRLRRLVLATGNPGKLREFQALLGPAWELVSQADLGVHPAEETGTTFAGNALIKARHAARLTDLPALADDSGIEVDALGGAPGVYSARYAGPDGNDAANNAQLLRALAGTEPGKRVARYRCALAFVRRADDPSPLVTEAAWEGHIAMAPRGSGGFGYDSLFVDLWSGLTAAELDPDEKNARSHRGQALLALKALLDREFSPADAAGQPPGSPRYSQGRSHD